MTLVEYLQSKGISIVAKINSDYIMSPCPHCGKESTKNNKHFMANDEVGHCFSCGHGGNFFQYIKLFNDDVDEYLGEKKQERKEFRNSAGDLVAVWSRESRKPKVKKLDTLPDDFLNRAQNLLWRPEYSPAEVARKYLIETRKFPEEALRSFQIGLVPKSFCLSKSCNWRGIVTGRVCPKCGGRLGAVKWWISIPYLTREGEVTLVKYRSIPPAEKAFEREAGGTTGLFGSWRLTGHELCIVVVESELDAVAVWSMGYPAVAIAGSKNWSDAWLEYFESAEEIILAGDTDDAGVDAMLKVAEKVGVWRCRMLAWPDNVKDAAEFIERGGSALEFRELVETAKVLKGRVWLSGADFVDIVECIRLRGPDVYGIKTGWSGLDTLLGGVRPGEVTVVTADTGSGKSMFCSEWSLRMAEMRVPSALASFELGSEEVVSRVLTQVAKKSLYSFLEDTLALQSVISNVSSVPFYFLDLRGSIAMDDLRAVLKWGVVRYGVRFIVLDHLHYFMRVNDWSHERQEIDHWVRTLCQWAEEWSTHIVLVVHPSKRGQDMKGKGRIKLGDLKGSSGISQEAHNVLALYRARGYEQEKEKLGEPVLFGATELMVLKARSPIAREGSAWFWFSRESLTYDDMSAEEVEVVRKIDSGEAQQGRARRVEKEETEFARRKVEAENPNMNFM